MTNIVQKPLMPLILQTRGRHFGSRVAFWSKPWPKALWTGVLNWLFKMILKTKIQLGEVLLIVLSQCTLMKRSKVHAVGGDAKWISKTGTNFTEANSSSDFCSLSSAWLVKICSLLGIYCLVCRTLLPFWVNKVCFYMLFKYLKCINFIKVLFVIYSFWSLISLYVFYWSHFDVELQFIILFAD